MTALRQQMLEDPPDPPLLKDKPFDFTCTPSPCSLNTSANLPINSVPSTFASINCS